MTPRSLPSDLIGLSPSVASGRPALVNLHAAAGTGNAMGNLTNTQSGHVPVVVTSGQQARCYTSLNAMLTNVDAPTLAQPLVKWSHEPPRPQDVPQALSKGILLASAGVHATQVGTLSDLTHAVKDALASDEPRLIEITQRRLADS